MNEKAGKAPAFFSQKNLKNFQKTIDKNITKCYNIGVIKRGKPQKERWIIMKKRYFVIWRTLDGENTSAGKVIMATNDKAKAYSYGRRNLPSNRELIIEDTKTGTIIHRELRA